MLKEQTKQGQGLTLRAFIIALLMLIAVSFWVRLSEIVYLSTQITQSIPAIPGLAALLLLPINALVRRFTKREPLSSAELIVIFLFLAVGCSLMASGVTQFLLSLITTPFYRESVAPVKKLLPQ